MTRVTLSGFAVQHFLAARVVSGSSERIVGYSETEPKLFPSDTREVQPAKLPIFKLLSLSRNRARVYLNRVETQVRQTEEFENRLLGPTI